MKKKKNAVYLNWRDIEFLSKKLGAIIKKSGFKPDIIVAIIRGGCIPGVLLSHILKIRDFCTLGVRTTTSDNIQALREIPIITDDSSLYRVKGKNVLLVDDVTNTGATLTIAKNRIVAFGCKEIKTAVLVWDNTNTQFCVADYYGVAVNAWVVFPWEKV